MPKKTKKLQTQKAEVVVVKPKNGPKQQPKKKKTKTAPQKSPSLSLTYATKLSEKVGRYDRLGSQQRIHGSDYLSDVTVTGSSGTVVLGSFKLNPLTMLPNSRLSGFAKLFEKYRILSLKVTYKPQSSALTGGNVLVWFEANPEIEWTLQGQELLDAVSALQCREMTPPFTQTTMNVPTKVLTNARGGRWYTNPTYAEDPADTYAGRIYLGVDNLDSGGASPLLFGRFIIEWTLEFYDAQNSTLTSDAFLVCNSTPGTAGQTKPFGTGQEVSYGDPGLMVLSTDGLKNILAFSTPGVYILDAFSSGTGGAALTNTSTIAAINGNLISNIIYQAQTQTQKVWRIIVEVLVAGGGFSILDTAGTHPNGAVYLFLARVDNVSLTKSQVRRRIEDDRYNALLAQVRALTLQRSPQKLAPDITTLSSTSTITGTVVDGNGPTQTVALEESTTYSGSLDVNVIEPPPPSSSSRPYSRSSMIPPIPSIFKDRRVGL